jgi:hypothetical protein
VIGERHRIILRGEQEGGLERARAERERGARKRERQNERQCDPRRGGHVSISSAPPPMSSGAGAGTRCAGTAMPAQWRRWAGA